jgi:hypothetical protein
VGGVYGVGDICGRMAVLEGGNVGWMWGAGIVCGIVAIFDVAILGGWSIH